MPARRHGKQEVLHEARNVTGRPPGRGPRDGPSSHRCGGLFMRSFPFNLRALGAACSVAALLALAACSGGSSGGTKSNTGTVTVAVVSNPLITNQMVPLTKSVFEKQN